MLRPSFEAACELVAYPVETRGPLLEQLIDALATHEKELGKSWLAKVGAEGELLPTRVEIPKTAPALWKDSKQADDTPPDFIKRYYGKVLRADATGLTRPDLFRLDRPLYVALSNWLRGNEMPKDCPLPTRSERVDAELNSVKNHGMTADIFRLVTAAQRRARKGSLRE